jgi:hypothetical protein
VKVVEFTAAAATVAAVKTILQIIINRLNNQNI